MITKYEIIAVSYEFVINRKQVIFKLYNTDYQLIINSTIFEKGTIFVDPTLDTILEIIQNIDDSEARSLLGFS